MDLPTLEASRDALDKSLGRAEIWLAVFTAIVVIGLILEHGKDLKEKFHEWRNWPFPWKRPPFWNWKKLLSIIGVGGMLVTLGVAGELYEEGRVSHVDTEVRQKNIEIETFLNQEAGDAMTSARTAHAEADAVHDEAEAVTKQLGQASRQLGQLEQNVVAQGPRWGPIAKVAPELTKQLSVFAGQRVEFFVCGSLGSQDGETLSTWGSIVSIVGTDGAKWKVERGGLEYFDRCSPSGGQPRGQGIVVFVSDKASTSTAKAATALGKGLRNALPRSQTNNLPAIVNSDFSKRYSQPVEGGNTPWAMVANDPDLITVLIGAHPQE